MLQKSIVLIISFFICYINSPAVENVPILLFGKILNYNKPLGINFQLVDENGNVTKSRSNSNEGEFQQVLQSGHSFSVFFDGYILDTPDNNLEIQPYKEYVEIKKEFSVKKIEANLNISKANGFKNNDSLLSEEGKQQLNSLKYLIKSQTGLKIDFQINISTLDCVFKTKKVTVTVIEKNKPKQKSITLTPEKQAVMMIDSRKNAIKNYLSELKVNLRNISFSEGNIINKNGTKIPIVDKKLKKNSKEIKLINMSVIISNVFKF